MWFWKKKAQTRYIYALIDTADDTLIALSTYSPALRFLNEVLLDTAVVQGVPMRTAGRIVHAGVRTYPEWSLDAVTRTFRRTRPGIVTEEKRQRAIFAEQKAAAAREAILIVNSQRNKLVSDLYFQDAIYAEKEREALEFKASGFDERVVPHAMPFLAQYAQSSNIPLKQAAEEILLRAQLDRDHLARTEQVRLALFAKIRSAASAAEMRNVLDTYRKSGVV